MPCDSTTKTSGGYGGGDENGSLRNFKLNESTFFLASLMPKKEIGADRFIEAHPQYDGRGAIIAIFDSGVDPADSGLQVASDGKPKVLDVIDCNGSGEIDTSKVMKQMVAYEELQKERKKKWDDKNQEEIAKAGKHLDEFNQKHSNPEDADLKRVREDLQNRIDLLRKQADSYDDDGELWRAALTQDLEDDSDCGKLANFVPLTNYSATIVIATKPPKYAASSMYFPQSNRPVQPSAPNPCSYIPGEGQRKPPK